MRSSSSDVSSPALHQQVPILATGRTLSSKAVLTVYILVCGVCIASWRRKNLPLVQIDVGLLAHQIRVAASHTLYLRQGVHDFLLAVDVCIEETEDELEVALLPCYESCGIGCVSGGTSTFDLNIPANDLMWICELNLHMMAVICAHCARVVSEMLTTQVWE